VDIFESTPVKPLSSSAESSNQPEKKEKGATQHENNLGCDRWAVRIDYWVDGYFQCDRMGISQ
jgi:hypothetical protein